MRKTPTGQRQYRLGLLTLVVEPTVLPARFEGWLPRTRDSAGALAEVELWVGGSTNRVAPTGSTRLVPGGVAVWIDEAAGRAAIRSAVGHAELDFGERWGRVSPRDGTSELNPLLNVSVAILLARVGAALVDASAVIDASGGGWLILGAPEDRSALVRAFVADGCDYVSDDRVVLRKASVQEGVIVIESWHRHRDPLPPERWQPVAQLRGVLLTHAIVARAPLPWRTASRDQALASLLDSTPHLSSDSGTEEMMRELLASCMSRPAITALISRDGAAPKGATLSRLAAAVDAIL